MCKNTLLKTKKQFSCSRPKGTGGYTMLMDWRFNVVKITHGPKVGLYTQWKSTQTLALFGVETDKLILKYLRKCKGFCPAEVTLQTRLRQPKPALSGPWEHLCIFCPDHFCRQGSAQKSNNPYFLSIRAESLPVTWHWDFSAVSWAYQSTQSCKGDTSKWPWKGH